MLDISNYVRATRFVEDRRLKSCFIALLFRRCTCVINVFILWSLAPGTVCAVSKVVDAFTS